MPDVSFTGLPGRRVLVRRFRPQDVAEFVACRPDAEVARYQSRDTPYPPEQGERFVAQMMTAHPGYVRGMVPVRRGVARERAADRRLCGHAARR